MEILKKRSAEILEDWIKQQRLNINLKTKSMKESERREQSSQFLTLLSRSVEEGNMADVTTPEWAEVREMLAQEQKEAKIEEALLKAGVEKF